MGGFFITNNKESKIEERILNSFKKKGLEKYEKIETRKFNVYYFRKKNNPNTNHIYKINNDYLIGVGTFFYKNKFGYQALKSIFNDYTSNNNDYKIFSKIRGHYNFILIKEDVLNIVTDRIGHYHSYIGKENDFLYISTSLLVILENLEHININKQELMEFLMLNFFIGNATPIQEIEFLDFGSVHAFLDDINIAKYYSPEEIQSGNNISNAIKNIIEIFKIFKDIEKRICIDLSGGYDTRLIGAIFKDLDITHYYNTNIKSRQEQDYKIPLRISRAEKKALFSYTEDFRNINLNYGEILKKNFYILELMRNNVKGIYTHYYLNKKSKDFDFIIGGWGGELYRDSKIFPKMDLDRYILKKMVQNDFFHFFSKEEINEFRKKLKIKILNLFNKSELSVEQYVSERIYYYINLVYWAGAHNTLFNQYCYRYHPLLEYDIMKYVMNIKGKYKMQGYLQKRFIEYFDRKFAKYKSEYGFNFLAHDKMKRIRSLYFKLNLYFQNSIIKRILKKNKRKPKTDKELLKNVVEKSPFFKIFKTHHDKIRMDEIYPIIYTVAIFLETFKHKIQNYDTS